MNKHIENAIELLKEHGQDYTVNGTTLSIYHNTLAEVNLTHEEIRHSLNLPQIWTRDEVYAELDELTLTEISEWLEGLVNNSEVMAEVYGELGTLYNDDLVVWLEVIEESGIAKTALERYIEHFEKHGRFQITDLKELAENDFEAMLAYVSATGHSPNKRYLLTNIVYNINMGSYDTFEEAYTQYALLTDLEVE